MEAPDEAGPGLRVGQGAEPGGRHRQAPSRIREGVCRQFPEYGAARQTGEPGFQLVQDDPGVARQFECGQVDVWPGGGAVSEFQARTWAASRKCTSRSSGRA